MRAKDLMRTEVVTVSADDTVETLIETFVGEHIHGAPVLDGAGKLVGMVTQQDIFFIAMTRNPSLTDAAVGPSSVRVGSIMTSPAVSANEDTEILALCEMMHRLRIHRVPVVCDDKIKGIISSLDICAALARGEKID